MCHRQNSGLRLIIIEVWKYAQTLTFQPEVIHCTLFDLGFQQSLDVMTAWVPCNTGTALVQIHLHTVILWQREHRTFLSVEAAAQLSQVSLINIHLRCLSFFALNYSFDRHMEVTAENNHALCLLCSVFLPWRLKLTPTWQIASLQFH